jgi:hypothetical protein
MNHDLIPHFDCHQVLTKLDGACVVLSHEGECDSPYGIGVREHRKFG